MYLFWNNPTLKKSYDGTNKSSEVK